jgi:hypothetical protein
MEYITGQRVGRAFSMSEAADILRISRRVLQELIKEHPYYYPNGNRKLFEESDVVALRAAMRSKTEQDRQRKEECRLNLSRRVR